jgi:uncharacterized membrane protein
MNSLLRLVKGWPGKPLHPPLTDASIGAYTVGVAALIAGKAGLQTPEMAHTALIAISFGLLLAAPTAITGLLDWLDIPKGTPARSKGSLALGGNIGGANVFVYGIRVLKRPDTPVAKALNPLGLPPDEAASQARTTHGEDM